MRKVMHRNRVDVSGGGVADHVHILASAKPRAMGQSDIGNRLRGIQRGPHGADETDTPPKVAKRRVGESGTETHRENGLRVSVGRFRAFGGAC